MTIRELTGAATDLNSLTPAAANWTNITDDVSNVTSFFDDEDQEDWYFICPGFIPANHVFFQIANLFLFLSYLAPAGIAGLLYLRSTLAIGLFFLSTWGYVILCSLDTFLWNFVCMWINIAHVAYLLWTLRPVKLEKEQQQVYETMFRPLNVSRRQFSDVLKCMRGTRSVSFQQMIITEGETRVDTLSLVLSGRFVVSQSGKALHVVSSGQFLDSPEWFSVLTDDFFQVSITAIEESRVLIWHRDKLKLSISNSPFLQAVFDNVLGRDVVKKLLQVAGTQVDKSFSLAGCSMNNGSASVLERGSVHSLAERGSVASLTDKPESTPEPVRSRTEEPKERPASDRGASDPDASAWLLGPIEETTKGGTRV